MTKKVYNIEQIVSIVTCDKKKIDILLYKEEQRIGKFKSFWNNYPSHMPSGFYMDTGYGDYTCYIGTAEELKIGIKNIGIFNSVFNDINILVEDNIAYYKPCVEIKYSNGEVYKKEYDTYDEALKFGTELENQLTKTLTIETYK